MEELLYTPNDLAWLIYDRKMPIKDAQAFIQQVWENESAFLSRYYYGEKRQFVLAVMHQLNYLTFSDTYEKEVNQINTDLIRIGSTMQLPTEDCYSNLNIFFKVLRLRIVILDFKDYVRMKLRTVLREHGYERRSAKLNAYLKKCLYFYHIETYLRGGEPCDIEEVGLDEMITFRVVGF